MTDIQGLLETWSNNNFVARASKRLEALADGTRQLQWAVFVKGCRNMWQQRAEALFIVGQFSPHPRRRQRSFGEYALQYVNLGTEHNMRYEWHLEHPSMTVGRLLACVRV